MNHSLTDYQRGNRDGLLSFATELDLKIIELDEAIATRTASRDKWSVHQAKGQELILATLAAIRSQTLFIKDLARRRSQALPEETPFFNE